jgi:hypothetical protein
MICISNKKEQKITKNQDNYQELLVNTILHSRLNR